MADDLEDESVSELDLDYADFKHTQLAIFKHDFRESSSQSTDFGHQTGLKIGFLQCLPLSRKLGRLIGTLNAINTFRPAKSDSKTNPNIGLLISECERVLENLSTVQTDIENETSRVGASEFTLEFAKSELPNFDKDDIDLLFGSSTSSSKDNTNFHPNVSRDPQKMLENKLATRFSEIQDEANELFEKCCSVLHSYGICDEFLYTSA